MYSTWKIKNFFNLKKSISIIIETLLESLSLENDSDLYIKNYILRMKKVLCNTSNKSSTDHKFLTRQVMVGSHAPGIQLLY